MTQETNRAKLECFMNKENMKGWQVNHCRRGTKYYEFAKAAISNPGTKIRTTVNPGKYQRCHYLSTVALLRCAGIDFESGNDAPKGGKHGNFVIVHE